MKKWVKLHLKRIIGEVGGSKDFQALIVTKKGCEFDTDSNKVDFDYSIITSFFHKDYTDCTD